MTLILKVNGKPYPLEIEGDTPLLWALRDHLKLTGTKFGCGAALCGACTVFVAGSPVRSCSRPVSSVGDADVTTIEGVSGREAVAVQRAWIAQDVPQCGYCQSGQIMSAIALLKAKPMPNEDDVDEAMSGNLCRCATYQRIRDAIHEAARTLQGQR
jgi:isoquinoline 1-oxidoreductase subunit alpha